MGLMPFFRIYRLGNNLAGQYKRGIGMALHIGIGNFSGAIAANIYRERDSPRFRLGRKSNSLSFSLAKYAEHTFFNTDTRTQMGLN